MSTEVAEESHCPDCGMEYKERVLDYYPPPQPLKVQEVAESDAIAEAHRDFECPVQKEKDNVALLESLLRYFGIGDTLAHLSKFVRENEHDVEIIWGDMERWFRKEQAARPFSCPHCSAALGVVDNGGLRIGGAIIDPNDEGADEMRCRACEKSFSLRAAMSAEATPPSRSGGIGTPRRPLSLVQPTSTEQEQ